MAQRKDQLDCRKGGAGQLKGIVVDSKKAEEARRALIAASLLEKNHIPCKHGSGIAFPVIDQEKAMAVVNCSAVDLDFRLKTRRETPIERLKRNVPERLWEFIPQGYDQVGKAIVIEIPDELSDFHREIGQAFFEGIKSLQSVYTKSGKVNGVFRLRPLELLAGKDEPIQVHIEHGVRVVTDLRGAYFSPRLSTEHARIAELVGGHEMVLDMFSGVGGFCLHMAKQREASCVAMDLNASAIFCLQQSMKLNKLKGQILPIICDARQLSGNKRFRHYFHRIIMNLPGSAMDFIAEALEMLRPSGLIHLHTFAPVEELNDDLLERVKSIVEACNRKIKHVMGTRVVRESAPYQVHVVLDLMIQ